MKTYTVHFVADVATAARSLSSDLPKARPGGSSGLRMESTMVVRLCPRKRAVGSEPLPRGPRQTTAIRREPRHVPRRSRAAD
jgi:hypothetical protein